MHAAAHDNRLPFGTLLGYAPGNVPAYSSDYDSVDSEQLPDRHAFRHYVDGVYTGYKWQCVEFARRWLLVNRGYVFDDIAMAYDIFRLGDVTVVRDGSKLPLHSFRNGAQRHPERGDMLIWNEGGEFEVTGHVAIVTDVHPDRIRVAEQNVHDRAWPDGADYSRELTTRVDDDGGYWIRCNYEDASILGWVAQTDDDTHAETFTDPDPTLFTVQPASLPDSGAHTKPWLNVARPEEAAFVASMKGHRLCSNDSDHYRYFRLSTTGLNEIKRATNELHALFMHATDHVMQNEQLLEHFSIPEALWPRIHQSWNNRRNEMITGRFDFCMTERGIKVFEYNADSASCHMECGRVQGLWASHFGCDDGRDPGERLHRKLVEAWRDSEANGMVHILCDEDAEETYHALYMQSAIEKAGLRSKIVTGLDGLSMNTAGEVLDDSGEPLRWVWKTWAWETALEQLRQELAQDNDLAQANRPPDGTPRLMDVLFRPGVMVYEPLWTLVTSNKALLPILWDLFPEHPYLLNSSYTLTVALTNSGYVSKPIAGRCGHNVSLVDKRSDVVDETDGRFDYQAQIYQELWRLPEIDGYRVQVCSFSVSGMYAGACLRVDPSLIITTASDVLPVRVVSDRAFLAALSN